MLQHMGSHILFEYQIYSWRVEKGKVTWETRLRLTFEIYGKRRFETDNHVYIQLVKVCDEIFRRLPVEPRKAMFMYFKQTGENLNAMYIRFVPCKYIRNYRSLRSEVLIEFIEFVKNDLLETNHDSYREMKEFISDKVKSIRMAGKAANCGTNFFMTIVRLGFFYLIRLTKNGQINIPVYSIDDGNAIAR